MAQIVKNLPAMRDTQVRPLGQEDPWRKKWQPIPVFFFSFIFISWRLITLQYCSGFCHTLT